MNQSVTVRTFTKEGQTFLIELRNWIWASQFSSFTAHVCYIYDTLCFYRTQVSLGSDLWVWAYVRHSLQDYVQT